MAAALSAAVVGGEARLAAVAAMSRQKLHEQ
jgi:hypothetical protein